MPVHFGGGEFDPEIKLIQSKGLAISYKTGPKLLENYIPEGFELLKPEVQVVFNNLPSQLNVGGQYNLRTSICSLLVIEKADVECY